MLQVRAGSFSVFLAALSAVSLLFSCGNHHLLKEVKQLDYPSASGTEYVQGKIFIVGDDAASLLVMDSSLAITDSISLYQSAEKRMPKSTKPDLESITLTRDNQLLLIGSGSLAPYRNTAWLIDPVTYKKDSIRLDSFFQRLPLNGIREINIEGSCSIPGYYLLANRGSKGYPRNQLIFAQGPFWKDQANTPLSTAFLGSNSDSNTFSGVSGMTYAPKSDRLLLTVSTEDTRNTMDDGAIGKSYLWIIWNISTKKRWKAINPDQVIDLDALDSRFKGQKIESVCLLEESGKFLHLLLVADNDNGSSTLFKMVVSKD